MMAECCLIQATATTETKGALLFTLKNFILRPMQEFDRNLPIYHPSNVLAVKGKLRFSTSTTMIDLIATLNTTQNTTLIGKFNELKTLIMLRTKTYVYKVYNQRYRYYWK